jgi:hypothetical protein
VPRSLTILWSDYILEITLGQRLIPDHEPEHDANASLLKFTVTGFKESTQRALERLDRTLPLADVEEVILDNVPLNSIHAKRLLRLVPRARRIVATGSRANIVVKALQPTEVAVPGE